MNVSGDFNVTGISKFEGNLTIANTTEVPEYFKFSSGGYMYDNGTSLILGHN